MHAVVGLRNLRNTCILHVPDGLDACVLGSLCGNTCVYLLLANIYKCSSAVHAN
jgi:hypothetical protein